MLVLLASGCDLSGEEEGEADSAASNAAAESADGIIGEEGEGLSLRLPTNNDALLRGDEATFYSPLDATIPGLRPNAWEGGQYGFVRNPAQTPAGLIFSRLHQGVDIRPLHRDAQGEPEDTVRSIDDGTVAYANRSAGNSSYGRYVVVRHEWDESPVYSLLAHLESVWIDEGTEVAIGDSLGRMGWTGSGLARHRAHVHLEVALLLNRHYQRWHDAFYGTQNHHGIFFGRNLMGVDPAALYLALREEPDLSFAEFVQRQPVAFRLALPGDRPLDILERYPWLAAEGVAPADAGSPGAWLISFTREGVPVEIARQAVPVPEPQVAYVAPEVRQRHLSTAGLMAQGTHDYHLTRNGRAFAALLATTADGVPPWF